MLLIVDKKAWPKLAQVHSAVRTAIQSILRKDLHLPLVVVGVRDRHVLRRSARLVPHSAAQEQYQVLYET